MRRLLREPLVHFLAIGLVLFLVFDWRGAGGAGTNRIVITPGQVDAIATGFTRTWQRPPTEAELKSLIDEYVREEIATRESMAMGLDRDDTVIRRRLRQKFEFVTDDGADAAPPTDAQLQAWLDAHPDAYRREARVAFRQVDLNPERHPGTLEADARKRLAELEKMGPDAKIEGLGDSRLLPAEIALLARSDLARDFGEAFAEAVMKAEPGRWVGPIRSGYGLHLVLVREREEGRVAPLEQVRAQVLRDYNGDRRRRALDERYAKLLERYRVVMEKRAP
jgi:PPIC-type PPIASE domain